MINHGTINYNFPQTAQSQASERVAGNLFNYSGNGNSDFNIDGPTRITNNRRCNNNINNTNINPNNNPSNTNNGFNINIANANANSNNFMSSADIDIQAKKNDNGSNINAVTETSSAYSISNATKESLVIFLTYKYDKYLKNKSLNIQYKKNFVICLMWTCLIAESVWFCI